jgi:purine nucleoside permease
MISLEKIDSPKAYVVVVGTALTMSEHDTIAAARSARVTVDKDGFEEATILKRMPEGWKPVK